MNNNTSTQINNPYILKVGEQGKHRLDLLNNVFNPYTLEFIKRTGLKSGMVALDVGCGVGNIAIEMAKIVGSAGKVVGIDKNAEQLGIAEKRASSAGISNIEFIQSSIYDVDKLSYKFDFAFSRFVLMHLTNPLAALQSIYNALRSGGFIACEEPAMTACFSSPKNSAFDRSMQMLMECSSKLGVDFDIGDRLYNMVKHTGFQNTDLHLIQPVVKDTQPEKQLFVLLAQESADKYIETGTATRKEISEVIDELAQFTSNPSTYFACARESQVNGQRP